MNIFFKNYLQILAIILVSFCMVVILEDAYFHNEVETPVVVTCTNQIFHEGTIQEVNYIYSGDLKISVGLARYRSTHKGDTITKVTKAGTIFGFMNDVKLK